MDVDSSTAATGAEPTPRMTLVGYTWVALCVAGVLYQLAARVVFYGPIQFPKVIDLWAGKTLAMSTTLLITAFVGLVVPILVAFLFLLTFLLRRRWCIRKAGTRFGLRAFWLHAAWGTFLLLHFVFDINPHIALWSWGSLPLALVWLAAGRDRATWMSRALATTWIVTGVVALSLSSGTLTAAGILTWFVGVPALLLAGPSVLLPPVIAIGIGALLAISQVVSTIAILVLPIMAPGPIVWGTTRIAKRWSRGLRTGLLIGFPLALLVVSQAGRFERHHLLGSQTLGPGLAYSFCEMKESGLIYAAIPVCTTTNEKCSQGTLAEYDLTGQQPPRRHTIFDGGEFWGRMEQVACIEGKVQVGLCCTSSRITDDEATLLWSPDKPDSYELFPDELTGRRIVYDERNQAAYYVGDHVVRLDRETGEISNELELALIEASDIKTTGGRKRMFLAESASLASTWNRLYLAEFNVGSNVYEIDLETQEIVSTLRPASGGVLAVAVDEELERLWITSMYGLEVYDARTRERLFRARTGTFPRMPVIDSRNDLVYVPTTIAGRIEVRDRQNGEKLGSLEIGLETRFALLTADGSRLLATSARAHHAWKTDDLVAKFRR